MDFKTECYLKYLQLFAEYNKTKNKKKKEVLIRRMEALKNGLMPVSTKEE